MASVKPPPEIVQPKKTRDGFDRRRKGRREYENAQLIAMLRGEPYDEAALPPPSRQRVLSWRSAVAAVVAFWIVVLALVVLI